MYIFSVLSVSFHPFLKTNYVSNILLSTWILTQAECHMKLLHNIKANFSCTVLAEMAEPSINRILNAVVPSWSFIQIQRMNKR